MVICSGYNVDPREIEELLMLHPAVQEAAVVGMPDPKRGESPVAFVILKPNKQATEKELVQYCRANLADYKAIKGVHFVADFPRNANRKVLKRELREVAMKQ
jgi:long-chain acyl-CoA synthetase